MIICYILRLLNGIRVANIICLMYYKNIRVNFLMRGMLIRNGKD